MAIPWGAIGSWLGNNAGNIAQLGMSLYGANQGAKATKQAAAAATPTPYSTSSIFGNVNVDPRTRAMTFNMGTSPFAQLFNVGGTQALGNAYSAPGSAYYGAAPEVAAAAGGVMDTDAEAAGRYDLLKQLAAPEENRMFQRLENNLFARGQMGTTGGGEQYRGFYEAQNQADLARQMTAQDWAQQRALSRFDVARNAVGQGMNSQVQNFNIGTGSAGGIQNLFAMLMQQANAGIGAGGGTPSGVALANAEASQAPLRAGAEFLNNSGAFDALGRWIGSRFGGSGSTNSSYSPGNLTLNNSGMPNPTFAALDPNSIPNYGF